ncbi:protein FAM217A [Octodon degus]|uniref:Protein FAM217A n=1 Tax=Octodon degus TaxID=10160 RepID=A0A6P3V9U5_OCTDE|nr:protein FAM217A [Octodon degus]
MRRRPGEAWGPVPGSVTSVSQENLCYWNLDSEAPAPENRNLPRRRNGAAGGKIEELCALSRALPSSPAGVRVGCLPALPMPALSWPYADGDFFQGRDELQMNASSTTENNSEALQAPVCHLSYANCSMEENLTDESDLSENEKANDTALGYFKVDLDLKPETIASVEESFREESSEAFLYPDFLPSPFDALDLHKLALSKCDTWKAAGAALDGSTERLITRLLELERLQHTTIQKERPRLQMLSCGAAASEQPSCSKATSKVRQSKRPDSVSLQTSYVDRSREKAKTNSGSGKPEQNATRWNWSDVPKSKWTPKTPLLKSLSTTKQLSSPYGDIQSPQSPTPISCQEAPCKPSAPQASQSLVNMASRRCLPPRSPIPVSSIALSFPENHKEETKTPRTRKKFHQRTILLKRPFYIQKLNCLPPSFIGKGKGTFTDQK